MPWIDKKKPHSCRLPRLRRGTAADAVWMCHRCSERWAVVATGNGRKVWKREPSPGGPHAPEDTSWIKISWR